MTEIVDALVKFLFGIFKNDYATVLCISAFPLIELKGAIPVGLAAGLPLVKTALTAYIGSTVVSIPLFFLLIPIFNLLKKISFIKKLIEKIEGMLYGKAKKLAENAQSGRLNGVSEEEKRKKADKLIFWSLFAFVALPLPMTGVWTGTAIAVFLNVKFDKTLLALSLGNFVAGSLVTLFTFIFKEYVDLVILILAAIAIIMLIIAIIKIARSPQKDEGSID